MQQLPEILRARRLGARALVALMAGLAVTTAWSSQVAGSNIGKVVVSTKTIPGGKSTPASGGSSSKPAATPGTRAASAAKR